MDSPSIPSSSGAALPGRALAWGWLWAAAVLFVVATLVALLQAPRPVPPDRQAMGFSFFHPVERNPIRRLPFIANHLTAVHVGADGRHVWAVGWYGAIVATDDGGKTWSAQTSGTPASLFSVSFNADGRRGWAVGDNGLILATNDGGKTWSAQVSGTPASLVSVSFNADGRRGWAVGFDGAIVATSDGGTIWSAQTSGTQARLESVSFNADGRRGWAVGQDGAIVATNDGGKTWSAQKSGTQALLSSLSFNADGRRGWAVGDDGAIVATGDGGTTWSAQPSGTSASLYSVGFSADGRRGWAAGKGGTIVATSDGGKTWSVQPSGTPALLTSVSFNVDGRRGWAVGYNGAIVATGDGGATWSAQTSGTQAWLNSVSFSADGQRGWAVGEGGAIVATSDGGTTWLAQASGTPASLYSVSFNAEGLRGWAVGKGGAIVATSDGGKTWSAQASGTQVRLESVSFNADGRRGWAVGDNGLILATSDGGTTWSAQASGTPASLDSVGFNADGLRGWAVGWGVIVATADGGKTWSAKPSGTRASLYSVSLSADGLHGWAVGGDGLILATSDGGMNWSEQASGAPASFYSVSFNADGRRGWAVGDNGAIVATLDGGKTWSVQTSRTPAWLASVSFNADGLRGWAVGQGGVIISTSDGGTTWRMAETYSRYPAPWYWLVVVLCAWFLWLAWAQRGNPAAEQSVAGIAASDAAVSSFADDRLEFAGLARGISRYLRNPATTPPLTLAITGDWGSGKSSLMHLVCADLARFGHRPIWFNAWHHQKQEHLFAALLGEVYAQAAPPLLSLAGALFRLRLLWCRSRRHFVASVSIVGVVSVLLVNGLTQGGSLLATVPEVLSSVWQRFGGEAFDITELCAYGSNFLASLTAIWALLKGTTAFGISPAVLLSESWNAMSLRKASSQNDFRSRFSRDFAEVAAALPYRMVIVIDDLDRCRPTAVLEVMEAVNYLTSSGECFVIFGMATDRVLAALGLAFTDIAKEMVEEVQPSGNACDANAIDPARDKRRQYALDYLQKLVNIEVKVPKRRGKLDELLAAEAKPAERPWRAVLRGLTQPWPVYVLTAVAAMGVWLGAMLPAGTALPVSAPAEVQSKSGAVSTVQPAVVQPAVAPPVPDQSPRQAVASSPGFSIVAGQDNPEYIAPGFVALGLIPLLGVAALIGWVALRRTVNETQDSRDFRVALKTWTALVAEKRATPRAVKRFGNRIRYFAMLQQGVARDETALDVLRARVAAWWRGIGQRGRTPPGPLSGPQASAGAVGPDAALDEPQLAAMGAIYEVWGANWQEVLQGDWSGVLAVSPGAEAAAQNDRLVTTQQKTIEKHKAAFGAVWPPSPEECAVFERLLQGIRMEGELRRLAPGTRPTVLPPGSDIAADTRGYPR